MIAASFFFSLMTVFVKYAGRRIPGAEMVFVRSVLALVITSVMLRRAGITGLGNNTRLLLFRGLLGFSALLCLYYAIPRLPLAEATVIQYTNPVFVAIFAGLFLKEAIGVRESLSVGLCIVGVLLIAQPSFLFGTGSAIRPGLLVVAIGGAVLSGAAYAVVRKLRESDHALHVILFFPLVSVPASLPFVIANPVWPNPVEWVLLVGSAVTSQIGQVFMTRSYHMELAARASTASYSQIVFAAIWGVLLFSEVPTVWLLAGSLMVVLGTAIVSFGRR